MRRPINNKTGPAKWALRWVRWVLVAMTLWVSSVGSAAFAQSEADLLDAMSAEDRAAWQAQEDWMAEQRVEHLKQMEAARSELVDSVNEIREARGEGRLVLDAKALEQAQPTQASDQAQADDVPDDALIREIQAVLKETGCYAYAVDGKWGPGSKRAVERFAEHAKLQLPDEPSQAMLVIVNAKKQQGRVCPQVCNARQELRNGQCVQKTCAAGQTLNQKGQCVAAQASNACPDGAPRTKTGQCAIRRNGRWCDPDAHMTKQACAWILSEIADKNKAEYLPALRCYCL